MKPLAIARNLLNPDYAPEMLRKLVNRLSGKVDKPGDREAGVQWCGQKSESFEAFVHEVSPTLAEETWLFAASTRERATGTLDGRGVLGGAGHYPLLYFLARLKRPRVIIETGVAAGYSSRAFLEAIESNGSGRLFSSDLPYFRMSDPESRIGTMVDERLRRNWELFLKGDRRNLPLILSKVEAIDLFHYDSDANYRERRFALDLVSPRFTPETVVVMDDVQDNLFFRDYTTEHGAPFRVFAFEGKFTGVIGV